MRFWESLLLIRRRIGWKRINSCPCVILNQPAAGKLTEAGRPCGRIKVGPLFSSTGADSLRYSNLMTRSASSICQPAITEEAGGVPAENLLPCKPVGSVPPQTCHSCTAGANERLAFQRQLSNLK